MRSVPRLRSLHALLLALPLLLTGAAIAHAGFKSKTPVRVDQGFQFAQGATGSARNTGNTTEQIGCQTNAQASYGLIECFATDANGQSAYCWVEDGGSNGMHQGSLPLMADGAYISFSWNAQGQCTAILVAVSSDNEPKRP